MIRIFSLGDPISPISIEGIDGPPPPARLPLLLAVSSKLILIIGIQSSSGPSPPPPPSVRGSVPPAPPRVHRPAAERAGTDSAIPPASRTPAVTPPSGRALSTNRPPDKSSR